MTLSRLASRAIEGWIAWRFDMKRQDRKRRLYSAIPALMDLDRRQSALARQHRPGVRAIERQKRKLLAERMRIEVRHG